MKNKLFLDTAELVLAKEKTKLEEKIRNNIKINYYEIDENNKKQFKRDMGKYFTISYNEDILNQYDRYLKREIIKVLKYFKKNITNYGTTLIIGLGNSSVTCDSLGPNTASKIIATNHYVDFLTIPKVAIFVPEVISKTGISSYDLIKMLVEKIKPSSIIIIDSLLTNNPKRLNRCVEITDSGIIPGSAIKTNRKINFKTFAIPLIAIGVPLVIEINKNKYTSLNIKEDVEKISNIIASALNELFFK